MRLLGIDLVQVQVMRDCRVRRRVAHGKNPYYGVCTT